MSHITGSNSSCCVALNMKAYVIDSTVQWNRCLYFSVCMLEPACIKIRRRLNISCYICERCLHRRAPRVFIGQGRFSEDRAQFFFQISSDKIRDRVAILYLRGLKVCNIFYGTPMVGAVGKILKTLIARLFQIAILELWFHGKRAKIRSK